MSVVFNALEKKVVVEEIREEKREDVRKSGLPIAAPPQETLLSVKLSIAFALFLSFAAVVFSIYLLQFLNADKKEREVFEAGYVQSQEKLQMMEYETKQYQSEMTKIRGEVAGLAKGNTDLSAKVEELRSEMSSVHQELAGVANSVREIKESSQVVEPITAPAVPPEPGN